MNAGTNSIFFDEIKKAVANLAQINYYNPLKDTRVASRSGLEATLEQGKGTGWGRGLEKGTGYRSHLLNGI